MSKGGGGGGRQQTSSTTPDQEYLQTRRRIGDMAFAGYDQQRGYGGDVTANLTSDQLVAMQNIRNMQGGGQDVYQQGIDRMQQEYDPGTLQAAQLNPTQFVNPFQDQVIDRTVAAQQQFLEGALEGEAAKAIAAGGPEALANSRYGIVRGQTIAQSAQDLTDKVAALTAQGYDKSAALSAAQAGRDDRMTGLTATLGLSAEGLNRRGAMQSAQLQNLMKRAELGDTNALMQIGAMQQQMAQQDIDYEIATSDMNDPLNKMQYLYPLLGAGAGQSSTMSGAGGPSSYNRNMGALGLAATGAGTGFMIGGPPGAAIGGAIGLAGGLMA